MIAISDVSAALTQKTPHLRGRPTRVGGPRVVHRLGDGWGQGVPLRTMLVRMTLVLPTLSQRDDVEDVLSEILRLGRPRPGTTLVAVIELATGTVRHIDHLLTPEPLPDDACDLGSELASLMSPTLCGLAQAAVPPRPWQEGFGWAVPDQELITVVCREGEPFPSPVEEQFFWGWRYSNHLTAAFHGDVYVVTPTGWAGLLGGEGEWPALPPLVEGPDIDLVQFPELAERRALLVDPIVREAAAILAETTLTEAVPERGECVICYGWRLMTMLGCDRTLRIAQRFRDVAAPRAKKLEATWARRGVTCDCQLLEAHGIPRHIVEEEYAAREADPDRPITASPPCLGVRKGSAQPCATWVEFPR